MTGLDPDLRYDKHKADIQANRFVRDHGRGLLPALYEVHNPMPHGAALDMEVELAICLSAAGRDIPILSLGRTLVSQAGRGRRYGSTAT